MNCYRREGAVSMVNVLQLGMTSNMGGVESYIISQFRCLDAKDLHWDFVSDVHDAEIAFAPEILERGSSIFQLTNRREWLRFFRQNKGRYQVLVYNTCDPFRLYMLVFAKMFGGVPRVIIHSHNGGMDTNRLIQILAVPFFWVDRFILSRLHVEYWACSRSAAKWMFGKRKKNVTIIHNSIDTSRFMFDDVRRQALRKELGIEDRFVVGHIGRFAMQKNHAFLVSVFSEIARREPRTVLLLVGQETPIGNGYMERTKKLAVQLGIENKIVFLGMRNDTDSLYQAMDCFLLPSLYEGLPIVGIEAQTAGLPCFFSDTISRDVQILPDSRFLPIHRKNSLELWADAVLTGSYDVKSRQNAYELVRTAGYDIHDETQRVTGLLRRQE